MFDLSTRKRFGISTLGLLVVLLVLGNPSFSPAQTAEEYRAHLERLLPEWRAALAAESRARERQPVDADTVRAGGLVLLALPGERDFVAAVGAAVEQVLAQVLGSDTQLLRDRPVLIYSEAFRDTAALVPGDHGVLQFHEGTTAASVADRVLGQLERQLAQHLDQRTRAWLGGNVPLRRPPASAIERVYLDLATSDSRSTPLCIEGNLAACREALAIADHEHPVTVWYGPLQRRRLVERLNLWGQLKELVPRCVEEGVDAACLEILSRFSEGAYRPLSAAAHRLLAWIALERGGSGAYPRFLTEVNDGIAERLTAAASGELDSIVASWRDTVMAGRPRKAMTTLWTSLAALGWILGLALLASRSSRWRLG
jgi:hypothetical protein